LQPIDHQPVYRWKPRDTRGYTLQKILILPKEKTTVWVKQNVKFFQQNGSVIKIEQN
jgi:hypothetical protein